MDEELLLRNEYLVAENRILRTQITGRVGLTDGVHTTLAELGKRLGKQALAEVVSVAKPETVLAWHRKLIARKFDGSTSRRYPGRAGIDPALEQFVVQFAKENRTWGYDRIVGALKKEAWMIQMARYATMAEWGFLSPGQHLLHDRDSKFWSAFQKTVKPEVLSRLILFGAGALRRALQEYHTRYHEERNHQGKGNELLMPRARKEGCDTNPIHSRERLGGLLNFYYRKVA